MQGMQQGMRAIALCAGLLAGGGLAFAQGQGRIPDEDVRQEQRARAGMCPGGCPLCDAQQDAAEALDQGITITMEQQPNGALLRFEAPAGDPVAIEAARDAAEAYAQALQSPATRQGCPCPRAPEGPPVDEEPEPFFP